MLPIHGYLQYCFSRYPNLSITGSNLKSSDEKEQSVYDENLCKICLDAEINCVLLNCGHFVSCTKCGRKLAECPICRQLIVRIVHIFRA